MKNNTDFEVMPVGALEEVKAMRKFSYEIVHLANQFDNVIPKELLSKIREMDAFYAQHILKYPL